MYPELAEMNPEPFSFEITKPQRKRQRNPQKLSCRHVENPSMEKTGYINVSGLVTPNSYAQNRDFASNYVNENILDEFQEDLKIRVTKALNIEP